MRIMIFDGAPQRSQDRLVAHGGATNAAMFSRALGHHGRDLDIMTINVADGERLPQGVSIADFDGVVVTGSPLNVYNVEPAVTRQLELAREIFDAGVPVWGSCWGLQLMTVALGGVVRKNPKGREVGVARGIEPTAAGAAHPLLAGRPARFDALCSHEDEVETLPEGAIVLARNDVSEVQAAVLERDGKSVWAVQYHPEHEPATAASILESRAHRLIEEGFAPSVEHMAEWVRDLREIEKNPARRDLAWRYGLGPEVMQPAIRTREIGNWLAAKVTPRAAARAAARA